jgi:hypothetical protein
MNQQEKRQAKRIERHVENVQEILTDILGDLSEEALKAEIAGRTFWANILHNLDNAEISIRLLKGYAKNIQDELPYD